MAAAICLARLRFGSTHYEFECLGKGAEREKQQHSADQKQYHANTIRSLDMDIGYRHHARNQNGPKPISRLFGFPQEPRSLRQIYKSL